MSQLRILLVEDEPNIARGLVFNLEAEGYLVTHADTGQAALQAFKAKGFDLVILDLMLPDCHGLEVCRKIRSRDPRLPILMLTALSEEEDRIAGLSEGADDYITKPFSLDEFLLRVQGILKRSGWYRSARSRFADYRFGENRVDLEEMSAVTPRGGVQLTDLECRMLETFFHNEGQVMTREQLLQSVWGIAADTETRTLDNFIVRLRKYFEENPAEPRHFQTVRKRGYRFIKNPDPDKS